MMCNHCKAKSNCSGCKCRKVHKNKGSPLYSHMLSNTWPAVTANHNFLKYVGPYSLYWAPYNRQAEWGHSRNTENNLYFWNELTYKFYNEDHKKILFLHILLTNHLIQWFARGRLSTLCSMAIQKSETGRILLASREKQIRLPSTIKQFCAFYFLYDR